MTNAVCNPREGKSSFLCGCHGISNQFTETIINSNIGVISLTKHTMVDLQLDIQEEATDGILFIIITEWRS